MKRAALFLLAAAALALPALAQSWYSNYNRGVAAVQKKNYAVAVEALQAAVAEVPRENAKLRADREFITYLPHLWLGIAKAGLNDPDGALAELHASEEQGVVQNTPFYGQLREWVSLAQQQKKKNAENAAAGSKRDANAAISRALSAQMAAVSVGGDRSDSYRAAYAKLQEALSTFNRAGTDVKTYNHARDIATSAHDLFASAAEEAKKAKANRPAPKPPQPQPRTIDIVVPIVENKPPTAPPPVTKAETIAPQPPPVAPVVTTTTAKPPRQPAVVEQKTIERPKPKPPVVAQVITPPPPPPVAKPVVVDTRSELEAGYRAYAAGDLATAESILTRALSTAETADGYILRGCARYTRAMLSRSPNALLESAAGDFRRALQLNGAVRLSDGVFSPKLVAFFEKVRAGG